MELAIIEHVAKKGGQARLLGGRAVTFLCGPRLPPELKRVAEDIDLFIRRADRLALTRALTELGCEPVKEFNILNGRERLMYYSGDTKIHVFIDTFRMYHTLDLRHRVAVSRVTLPPADLLLTKLQIVDPDRTDLVDMAALLVALPLDREDRKGIDTTYLARRLGADWGLWRTATNALAKLRQSCGDLLPSAGDWSVRLIRAIDVVEGIVATAPKSLAWQVRSIAGERIIWYVKPDKPDMRKPAAPSGVAAPLSARRRSTGAD
jgi:hypothetical protein